MLFRSVTRFSVNQKIGGSMWVYLGTFQFRKGRFDDQGVMLGNRGKGRKEVVSADAVKFGGGTGNMARKPATRDENGKAKKIDYDVEPEVSGYPRFTEGSRYWLQWSGFDADVYSPNKNQNDYTDDYQSRGIWVNALNNGSVNNPKGDAPAQAKKIPIDLSLAFHTDAGTCLTDSIVGTLAIYTRMSNDKSTYPDGFDRGTARDYCDIVQTQIVNDIRATYEPLWNRRGLWDRSYAESRAPEVPAMLLELLSHENFADMRYGQDPAFRFTVSRAIYKGMLRYLGYRYGVDCAVAPLPVRSFSALLRGDSVAVLSWKATPDALEPGADAKRYIVYRRVDDAGFDNGTVVDGTSYEDEIIPGHIFSYKVEALNEGGKSFPSEVMSVGVPFGTVRGRALVVNGFDRVSAPASFATPDSTRAGFDFITDSGVPYIRDINMVGEQHEYRRKIRWMDDDAPGFGASFADLETKVIAGNTFDYTKVHGEGFMKKGFSFSSSSRDAVTDGRTDMNVFRIVDIIFGKQVTTQVGRDGSSPLRYTVFPLDFQKNITSFCKNGGDLLLSGTNIATDIWDQAFQFTVDSARVAGVIKPSKDFAENILHWKWMTNHASVTGLVKSEQTPSGISGDYRFNTEFSPKIYRAESPDGIVPSGKNAYTIMRYKDNDISAGVAYDGSDYRAVSLGFPIEALTTQEQVNSLIGEVCDFFRSEKR